MIFNLNKKSTQLDILEKIVIQKRKELVFQKESLSPRELYKLTENYICDGINKPLSMQESLKKSQTGIIAEFKRRSPSKGWIKEEGIPEQIPLSYSENGASAISILTNKEFFGGSTDYIKIARKQILQTPILRKEFIIDEYQIFESRLIGADAILLIAAELDKKECKHLASTAHMLGLETLLEIHDKKEIDYLNDDIDMLGVNNRNLTTFKTDVSLSFHISSMLPNDYVLVSESGINCPTTVKELRDVGFRGFLIGEAFMSTPDPGNALKQFINSIES